MAAAFGFSAGDFITAIGLIAKVSNALKDTNGASVEYQQVVLQLNGLKRTLLYLEALEPNEYNADHVNAIRCMAVSCKLPLQQFLDDIQKYEKSLAADSVRKHGRKDMRKAQWGIYMEKEVAKMRSMISTQVMSINLLLSAQKVDSLARIESRIQENHDTLLSHIQASQAGVRAVHPQIDMGVNILGARLDDHDTLVCNYPPLSSEIRNLPKIGVHEEMTQLLLNTTTNDLQESLSTVKSHIIGETALLPEISTLPSQMVKPTSQLQDSDTQSAVNQAQCILQIKDEIMSMHQTLRINFARLDAMRGAPVASNSAFELPSIDYNAIKTLLVGLRKDLRNYVTCYLDFVKACSRALQCFSKTTFALRMPWAVFMVFNSLISATGRFSNPYLRLHSETILATAQYLVENISLRVLEGKVRLLLKATGAPLYAQDQTLRCL
ncbi:MAG: hypothetical protein Q9187_002549 [Circinaria calcarea]